MAVQVTEDEMEEASWPIASFACQTVKWSQSLDHSEQKDGTEKLIHEGMPDCLDLHRQTLVHNNVCNWSIIAATGHCADCGPGSKMSGHFFTASEVTCEFRANYIWN